jgi:phage-related minor tail protein
MGVVAALAVKITANISEFQKQLGSLEKSLGKTASQLESAGSKLTKGLTVPLVAAGAVLLKVGKDFDDAYDQIRASTGATGDALKGLSGSFKNVLGNVPASMSDTATAISDLNVRTGATGPTLEALATQMLNLSRLTGTEVGPLVQTTTRLFGDWSIATKDQSAALDFLFKTSQSTGIGVQRLSDMVVQFGAPLRALGFGFEEAAALMGKWEKEGVNIETVLSGLRMGLKTFAKAGLEPAQALKDVQQAILGAKTESEATGIAFKVFGARAAVDMSRAIIEGRFNIDDLVKSLKTSKETINSAAADTLSLGERMQLLGNRVLVAVEPIATQFVGGLEKLVVAAVPVANVLGSLGSLFMNLPSGVQTGAIAFVALLAAIGPLTYVVGSVTGAFSGLLSMIRFVSPQLVATFAITGGTAAAIAGVLALAGAFGVMAVKTKEAVEQLGFWETARIGLSGAFPALLGGLGEGMAGGTGRGAARSRTKGKDVNLADPVVAMIEQAERQQALMKRASATRPDLFGALDPKKAKAATKAAAEWAKEQDKLTGKDALARVAELETRIAATGAAFSSATFTVAGMKQAHQDLSDALDYYGRKGLEAPQRVLDLWIATSEWLPKVKTGITELATEFAKLNVGVPFAPGAMLGGPGVTNGVAAGVGTQLPMPQMPTNINKFGVDLAAPHSLFRQMFGEAEQFGHNLAAAILRGVDGVSAFLGNAIGGKLSSMLNIAMNNAAASGTGFFASSFGKFLGGAISSLLPMIGPLLAPLINKIAGFFKGLFDGNEGRDMVKTFADSFATVDFFGNKLGDGFDKLHEKLLALGEAGEQMWIRLTQAVGRDDKEGALAAVRAAEALLAGGKEGGTSGDPMAAAAEAAGFKTQADLQIAASKAVELYNYMAMSGKFSAESVRQAWEAANTALIAAGDAGAIAAEKTHAIIAELDGQIKTLSASIATEAPEEIMGVMEQAARGQLAVLEQQRKDAQAQLEANAQTAGAGVQTVIDQLNGQEIHIKTYFDLMNGVPSMTGGEAPETQPGAGGGGGLWEGPEAWWAIHHPGEPYPGPWAVPVPKMATGGYVPPRPGGTAAIIGEGGEGEYVVPESQMGGVTNYYITVHGSADQDFADRLARVIGNGGRTRTLWRGVMA